MFHILLFIVTLAYCHSGSSVAAWASTKGQSVQAAPRDPGQQREYSEPNLCLPEQYTVRKKFSLGLEDSDLSGYHLPCFTWLSSSR